MEKMQDDWIKRKFVNPGTAEGKPQTEKLKYARELVESFGVQDSRFSCAVMVSSTMQGYGLKESSDIFSLPNPCERLYF